MSRRTAVLFESHRPDGQTMAEYSLVLAVITLLAVGVFVTLGETVQRAVAEIVSRLP